MQLTLTYIKRYEKTSKNTGKPFTSVSIKAKEYGDKYISGFGGKDNASWKEGDVVEVASVVQKGEYLNFEMPKVEKPGAIDMKILTEIANGILTLKLGQQKIIEHLAGKKNLSKLSDGSDMPFPEEEPYKDDPFAGME